VIPGIDAGLKSRASRSSFAFLSRTDFEPPTIVSLQPAGYGGRIAADRLRLHSLTLPPVPQVRRCRRFNPPGPRPWRGHSRFLQHAAAATHPYRPATQPGRSPANAYPRTLDPGRPGSWPAWRERTSLAVPGVIYPGERGRRRPQRLLSPRFGGCCLKWGFGAFLPTVMAGRASGATGSASACGPPLGKAPFGAACRIARRRCQRSCPLLADPV